jgi:hypothetical protein
VQQGDGAPPKAIRDDFRIGRGFHAVLDLQH